MTSTTAAKAEALELQYASIIERLIADAVRPPLENFQESTNARLDVSAKAVNDAVVGLGKQGDRIGNDLRQQLRLLSDPMRESIEQLADDVGRLSADAISAVVRAEVDRIAEKTERLSVAINGSIASLRVESLKVAEETAHRTGEVSQSIGRDLTSLEKVMIGKIEALRKELVAARGDTEKMIANVEQHVGQQTKALGSGLASVMHKEAEQTRKELRAHIDSKLSATFEQVALGIDHLRQLIESLTAFTADNYTRAAGERNIILRQLTLTKRFGMTTTVFLGIILLLFMWIASH
jgi:hypothetical protein